MENKRKKRSAFDRVSAWLLDVLLKSPIGKLFTSYDKINDNFQEITKNKSKNRHATRKKTIERTLEDNLFSRLVISIIIFVIFKYISILIIKQSDKYYYKIRPFV